MFCALTQFEVCLNNNFSTKYLETVGLQDTMRYKISQLGEDTGGFYDILPDVPFGGKASIIKKVLKKHNVE